MRARPETSLAQPRYSQELMVESTAGDPVQDGNGPLLVDVLGELLLGMDEVDVVETEDVLVEVPNID